MKKLEIVKEICGIVPLDLRRAYGLRRLRKAELEALLSRLRQKECNMPTIDFQGLVRLERKHDLCEKCDHAQRTPYGMHYCNANRRIKSINRVNGVTFEKLPNAPKTEQICVTVSCNRVLPKKETHNIR